MRGGKPAPFYKEPYFYLENPHQERQIVPVVKYNVSKEDVIIYTICKAGWYNGNPTTAYNAPIDEVIKAYQFEKLSRQYKETVHELNKARK